MGLHDSHWVDKMEISTIGGLQDKVTALQEENERLKAEAKAGNIPYRDAITLQQKNAELEKSLKVKLKPTKEWMEKWVAVKKENDALQKRVGELEEVITRSEKSCKDATWSDPGHRCDHRTATEAILQRIETLKQSKEKCNCVVSSGYMEESVCRKCWKEALKQDKQGGKKIER